jgi:sugar transferase (PEP-CTERM system associated)
MRTGLRSRKGRAVMLLWLAELVLVVLALQAATWLRYVGDAEAYAYFVRNMPLWPRALTVALFITGAMAAFGLYEVHTRHDRRDLVLRLALSFAFGGVALAVLYYLAPVTYIGRSVLTLAILLAAALVLLVRLFSQRVFEHEQFKRRVLVFGAGQNASLIEGRMRRRSDRHSFQIVGYRPMPGQPVEVAQKLLVDADRSLRELVDSLNVHEIVVAIDERRGALPMEELLGCAQRGVRVTDLSSFFEREAGMVKLSVADPSSLVFSGGFDHSLPRRLSKRFFDLIAASALLLLAWPAMLMVALCIWLETGTPIFYRQMRVGENGRSFNLIKFRSMRVDAEKDGVARWASRDDDRSTRVGRFIRLTRLDELPQLVNVLAGDMSFVGPRPERPQFVDQLSQEIRYYGIRHSVKPGLTGWAQLRYPYGASVRDAEEKLKFDLFYVKNQGLLFDLMILLQTVEVVVFRRGAR